MAYYVGLDVSVKETSICIMDDKGEVIAHGCLNRSGFDRALYFQARAKRRTGRS